MKNKRKLKKAVIPSIIGVLVVTIITTLFIVNNNMSEPVFEDDVEFNYTTNNIFSNELPTIAEEVVIIKPFVDETVKINKAYYDYKGEKENQQNALILYENTYMQNSGIDYNSDKVFDIISILDGMVVNVGEDELLGKFVEVRHSNDMISMYQSLSEVNVKKDDTIKQGHILGKSGKNNINPKLENQLHFELSYKGQYVNPEEYFDKKVQDL
ncbi:MAG: M23 family metallopeptidase [Firmicutes bacterium]|nr:M23 family metallopeptidase [Bacillota bacterium]